MLKNTNINIIVTLITITYMLIIVINNKKRLVTKHFKLDKSKRNIDNILNQLSKNVNTKKYTTHFWNETLDPKIRSNIDDINTDIYKNIGNNFVYVPSMTEIYYSSNNYNNSDTNYILEHMDGPFYNCNLYRALIVIQGNRSTFTLMTDDDMNINLKKYEVLIFDYNNAPHYIEVNKDTINNDQQRIILKLHYTKNNKDAKICSDLHCKFGRKSRISFEYNKKKNSLYSYITHFSLFYNAKRKYSIIILLLLLLLYARNKNKYLLIFTYFFTIIECIGIMYYFHFYLINYQICSKK